MAFDLLSPEIRKFVYRKGWEQLRPIQAAAITKIMGTTDNYILASRTASGKTEAAFLPILSKINIYERGVQVLYISPLIALINDQFYRIEELCKDIEVPVTKWHGEASRGDKNELLKDPSGIVLITPESLEAMFVNKPYNVRHLFASLKYVVIDEIHSFIGTDRGTQLQSLLSRLQGINGAKFSVVGLSATIGDYTAAKQFTGNEAGTKVLLDKTAKEIEARFKYFFSETEELSTELLKDLYRETCDKKVLVFPNSRGRAEEVAVKLSKISGRTGGHPHYFSHHSSVDKQLREYVEIFAKTSRRRPFCISCTSTLELGIDIGTVDEVVQIDSTHSIASLIQRVGRSGRTEGALSVLQLYATRPWSLLQSLACWLLYREGFIEPPHVSSKPFDILLHQALSILKSSSGIAKESLIRSLHENFAFKSISTEEIIAILEHAIATGLIEKLDAELIIGIDGEPVVNSREFYSVFISEDNLRVVHSGNTIGQVPYSTQIVEGENLLLAAKMWKIKYVDTEGKRIEVVPAIDGKKPVFSGSGASIHSRVREKMLALLFAGGTFEVLDAAGEAELDRLRKGFEFFQVTDLSIERPVFVQPDTTCLFTFRGSRFNRTLSLLLRLNGIANQLYESESMIEAKCSKDLFLEGWSTILTPLENIDDHLLDLLSSSPQAIGFSKWGGFLPLQFQVQLLRSRYFDFEEVNDIRDWNLKFAEAGIDEVMR